MKTSIDKLFFGKNIYTMVAEDDKVEAIAVKDGKIAKIAPSIADTAAEIIDAAGLQVAPGFIDSHSHSDSAVYTGNDCYNYIEQGVTTQIAGQCGSSPAPYHDELRLKSGLTPEQAALRRSEQRRLLDDLADLAAEASISAESNEKYVQTA